MKHMIAAEHFRLTPSIREHVERSMAKMEGLFPEDASVRLFLSRDKKRFFTARYKVHTPGRDLISQESGPDLYSLINQAGNALKRHFVENRRRRDHMRRIV